MASNYRKERTVVIPILEPAKEVGKALHIITADPLGISKSNKVWTYVPLSTVWEIHPDHVVIDEWIARKNGLVE